MRHGVERRGSAHPQRSAAKNAVWFNFNLAAKRTIGTQSTLRRRAVLADRRFPGGPCHGLAAGVIGRRSVGQ